MAKTTERIIALMKEKREKEGLSIRSLSEKIGVSFSTLARIERGDGVPDNNTQARIVNWLGSSARDAGVDFERAAEVHFRAAKNVDGTTVRCLLEVAELIKKQFADEEEHGA